MQTAKETAANITASALSGMEKTKAVIEEKVERISRNDPVEKDMATLRKEDRIRVAEMKKQEAYSQNAAAAAGGTESYTASGAIPWTTETTGGLATAQTTRHEGVTGSEYPEVNPTDSTGPETGYTRT